MVIGVVAMAARVVILHVKVCRRGAGAGDSSTTGVLNHCNIHCHLYANHMHS